MVSIAQRQQKKRSHSFRSTDLIHRRTKVLWQENHQPRAESQQIVPSGTLLSTTPRQVLESSTGDSRLWCRRDVVLVTPQDKALVWPNPNASQGCVESSQRSKRGRESKPRITDPTTIVTLPAPTNSVALQSPDGLLP